MRLALRGGENAVEETIARVRGEYKKVLLLLVAGVELFLVAIPFMTLCKLTPINAALTCIIAAPLPFVVFYFWRRADSLFLLDKKVCQKGGVAVGCRSRARGPTR
jgi:hypothetical protein